MFKLALSAGHGLYTPGKRCLKTLDPNETREWALNSRICNKIEEKLKAYEGYELIRCDDATGQTDKTISQRAILANKFKADFYLSVHHNAGIAGGSGGGIEAYVYTNVDNATKQWQTTIYNSVVAKTGLKGNRSQPLRSADFGELRETAMPAVLIECGYMDSTTDTPIILTEDFANKVAEGCVEAIVTKLSLNKKADNTVNQAFDITYQVWDNTLKKWLPNVKNLDDYAGIIGHDAACIYANLSGGNIFYKVHVAGGGWLPEVKNREDYAGLYNKPIDALMMRTDTGRKINYAVHLKEQNRWLPFVTGYSESDSINGYAGIIGKTIDAVKIYIG